MNDASGIRLDPAAPLPVPEAPVSLGRRRMVGEICDGKCFIGIMRYGSGLAHKACASLCLRGSLAPVFVSYGTNRGQFLFLARRSGRERQSRKNFSGWPQFGFGLIVRWSAAATCSCSRRTSISAKIL